jgi:glycosyltransferase involved in cell wall biosynthesis
MPKIHWVYPSGPQVRTPFAIGRRVAAALRARGYEVVQWDWDDDRVIEPEPGDILVGHAHPIPWTVFWKSSRRPGWKRIVAVGPYSHGRIEHVAWFDWVIRRCDQFLAITGPFWFRGVAGSEVAHWLPKMVHLDLAVDRAEFPRVKARFNPPGKRRFLYVGSAEPYKNLPFLSRLGSACAPTEFAWIGGDRTLPGVKTLGFHDFGTPEGRAAVAGFDFLLAVGDSDPNPTTLLEGAAWGLVPVCTPQSGYDDSEPGFVKLPLNDVDGAAKVIRELQEAPEERLVALRDQNDRRLAAHYNWDRFCQQVIAAIESDSSPAIAAIPTSKRLHLAWAALTGTFSPLRRLNRRKIIRANRKRRQEARAAARGVTQV